tara:strand:+ start:671 stop:988 length:318 start_codon:yes stop_codon:yes gene_type:complete
MPREDYTHKMVNGERVDLTEAEIDECVKKEEAWAAGAAGRAWKQLRTQRNNKLAVTDWRASSDITMSDEWKAYRQALRDITKDLKDSDVVAKKFFEDLKWPSEPS